MVKQIKRVLITGANGFIGKNVVDSLAGKYQLVCLIKDTTYNRNGVKMIYGDVTDEKIIVQAVKGVDAIVHLAAILNPFDKDIGKVNVGSTRLLVNAAKKFGVKKLIFISTENVLYDFDDAYSETKKSAERIVKTFDNHLILRPTLVYGKHDEKYVKRIIRMAKKYNVSLVPGDGRKIFQPVYVQDVVRCIENGLKYNVKGEYMVAGPSRINYDEFVMGILRETGTSSRIIHIPLSILKAVDHVNRNFLKIREIRIFQVKSLEMDKVYDISKSTQALKYKPTPFDIGMKETIKSLKDL
ncbi:NAD-dependent epimerase/dehydratase family protein [archaeon]|nr:MAG: NAD-dependent epimerase/dehydratase family protein [archaeon]